MTHTAPFEARRHQGLIFTTCGQWVRPGELGGPPTCPVCAAADEQTAEDVFGPPTVGTQVESRLSDPLAGYAPKGTRQALKARGKRR